MKTEKRAQKFHTDDAHYPDLDSAFDWLKIYFIQSEVPLRERVTRHQYGISARVPQTSFRGKTSGGVAKCRLFSQARLRSALVNIRRKALGHHMKFTQGRLKYT